MGAHLSAVPAQAGEYTQIIMPLSGHMQSWSAEFQESGVIARSFF